MRVMFDSSNHTRIMSAKLYPGIIIILANGSSFSICEIPAKYIFFNEKSMKNIHVKNIQTY